MSKWSEFYKDRLNDKYQKHIETRYAPFINELTTTAKTLEILGFHPIFVELGCGIGSITKAIQKQLPHSLHLLYDNDESMLCMAHKNLNSLNTFFHKKDLLNSCIVSHINSKIGEYQSKFNNKKIAVIVHSHGVLEHFSDNDIRAILKDYKQHRDFDKIKVLNFHYVPSHAYKTKSFGDERLLSPNYWANMFCKTVIEFNSGYDLIIKDKT